MRRIVRRFALTMNGKLCFKKVSFETASPSDARQSSLTLNTQNVLQNRSLWRAGITVSNRNGNQASRLTGVVVDVMQLQHVQCAEHEHAVSDVLQRGSGGELPVGFSDRVHAPSRPQDK